MTRQHGYITKTVSPPSQVPFPSPTTPHLYLPNFISPSLLRRDAAQAQIDERPSALESMYRKRARSLRSLSKHAVASSSTASTPAMPNAAVKMSSTKTLAKLEMGAAQPRISAAAAGDVQVASVTKAGDVLLKKPQQAN